MQAENGALRGTLTTCQRGGTTALAALRSNLDNGHRLGDMRLPGRWGRFRR